MKLNSERIQKDNWKTPEHLETKQHISNKAWIKEETSRGIKTILNKIKMKKQLIKICGIQ